MTVMVQLDSRRLDALPADVSRPRYDREAAGVGAASEPGLTLEGVIKSTAREVQRTTKGAQVPWWQSSYFGDFFFRKLCGAGRRGQRQDSHHTAGWKNNNDSNKH